MKRHEAKFYFIYSFGLCVLFTFIPTALTVYGHFRATLYSGCVDVHAGDTSNLSADDSCDDDDSGSSYRRRLKNKRGIFPKSATSILKAWLFQNLAVSACVCIISRACL